VKSRSLTNSTMAVCLLGALAGVTACHQPKGITADSPIKVRGGAMAFRSKSQWTQETSSGQVAYYLNSADISSITFTGVTPPPSAPILPTGCWTMTLKGRLPANPSQESANGITIQALDGSCNPPSGYHAITLTPFGSAGFYPEDYKPDDDGTFIERFMDTTLDVPSHGTTAPVPGCQGPSGLSSNVTGDEDICERMSTISLVLYTGPTPGSSTTYKCKNGDCEIDIGK
jgi:hypothetical protein